MTCARLAPLPLAVFAPALVHGSARPGSRVRHASCVVAPPPGLFPPPRDGALREAALVLGG